MGGVETMSNLYILAEKFLDRGDPSLQETIEYENSNIDGTGIRSDDGSQRIAFTHKMTLCIELGGDLYAWKTIYKARGL